MKREKVGCGGWIFAILAVLVIIAALVEAGAMQAGVHIDWKW